MMPPHEQFCPNPQCGASGQSAAIRVHSQKDQCRRCGKTFSATTGSTYAGLKKEAAVVYTVVITLLAYGCLAAIAAAYGLDVRPLRPLMQRAGAHCQRVHEYAIDQFEQDLQHIQANELTLHTHMGVLLTRIGHGSVMYLQF